MVHSGEVMQISPDLYVFICASCVGVGVSMQIPPMCRYVQLSLESSYRINPSSQGFLALPPLQLTAASAPHMLRLLLILKKV